MTTPPVWARPVRPAVAVALVACATVAAGAAYLVITRPDLSPPGRLEVRAPLPAGTYPPSPLPPGSASPPVEADGWVNGPYPGPDARTARLVVLDIWAGWCPACQNTAPGVLAAYRKYKDLGVTFFSLTNLGRDAVQSFADRFEIPWPCGYGATLAAIARFGAYSPDWMTDSYNPGYEVRPTLFIFGPDGRVRWHDDQARPRHLADTDTMIRNLDAAIERELAALPAD